MPADTSWPRRFMRTVDHCFGQYQERDEPMLPGRNLAQQVRDGLAEGKMEIVGREVVDGRELIKVVRVFVPSGRSQSWRSITGDGSTTTTTTEATDPPPTRRGSSEPYESDIVTYVDPETYRPVMVRGYVGSDAEYTQTYTYLPRTEANLAVLVPPVPDGFAQVDQLAGDGARHDAGCP